MMDGVKETATFRVKAGLAEMLKGGVIMDVVTADQARISESAGAVAVMALERVPADILLRARELVEALPDLLREGQRRCACTAHGGVIPPR